MKKLAFLASLVLIFVIPWENTVLLRGIGTLSRLVGLLTAGLWILAVVIEGNMRRPTLFHALVAAFVGWNALSLFWTVDPETTAEAVWTYGQLLILVFLIWDLYSTTPAIRAGLQAYVLGAYVALGSIMFSYLTDRAGTMLRYSIAGSNADTAGLLLALGMPIAWGLALVQTQRGSGGLLRWLNFAYLPIAFLGITLTATRAALITTVPAILFAVASLGRLSLGRRRFVAALTIAGVVALLPLVPATSVERLLTTGTEIQSGGLGGRGHIWRMGVQVYGEHPIIGVGSGAYKAAVGIGSVAHNTFLSVLVELGIVGFALFLAILAVVAILALKHPPWGVRFWWTLLGMWALAGSSMTWEGKKFTWVILTLAAASGAVEQGVRAVSSRRDTPMKKGASPESR